MAGKFFSTFFLAWTILLSLKNCASFYIKDENGIDQSHIQRKDSVAPTFQIEDYFAKVGDFDARSEEDEKDNQDEAVDNLGLDVQGEAVDDHINGRNPIATDNEIEIDERDGLVDADHPVDDGDVVAEDDGQHEAEAVDGANEDDAEEVHEGEAREGAAEEDNQGVDVDSQGEAEDEDNGQEGCLRLCPHIDFVCGSDGLTYASQCDLDNVACLNPGEGITTQFSGNCTDDIEQRDETNSASEEQDHTIDDNSEDALETGDSHEAQDEETDVQRSEEETDYEEQEECLSNCPHIDLVCGSNGLTYASKCDLFNVACLNPDEGITTSYSGYCKDEEDQGSEVTETSNEVP